MFRAVALLSVFAAGAATAQPVVVAPVPGPAAAVAAATAANACGGGVLLGARFSGPNQVTAVCRPPVGLQFGGLGAGAAAAAGAIALAAVVIAIASNDDDNGSTNGTVD